MRPVMTGSIGRVQEQEAKYCEPEIDVTSGSIGGYQ